MMKCLVLDDEPLAAELIAAYIRRVPFLELLGLVYNPLEALQGIEEGNCDLLFADINMPDLNGLELARIARGKTQVIFCTAYSEHALDSYDLQATDYLVKPVSFERFLTAVTRATELFQAQQKNPLHENAAEVIFIKSEHHFVAVQIAEIRFIEGLKDYVKIVSPQFERPLLSLTSLRSMTENLPSKLFVRVHKSYIVNLRKIDQIHRKYILIGDREIPIGQQYRAELLKELDGMMP